MKPLDLLGCGALNVDLIYRLPPTFPLWDDLGAPGTEQLMDANVRRAVDEALAHVEPTRSGGGQAANTAHALARLGYRAAMTGRVGDDEDGPYLLGELAPAEGRLVARDGTTGRVYVLLDEDGERVSFALQPQRSRDDLLHRQEGSDRGFCLLGLRLACFLVLRLGKELHPAGDDLDRVAAFAVGVLPGAAAQASVDCHLLAAGEVLGAGLGLPVPADDTNEVGTAVGGLAVDGKQETGQLSLLRQFLHLHVASQVSYQGHAVHDLLL